MLRQVRRERPDISHRTFGIEHSVCYVERISGPTTELLGYRVGSSCPSIELYKFTP